MKGAPRFWPAATLILLPVAVLAGLAAYGLVQHRAAEEARAVKDCRIELVAETWSQVLDEALEASPDVVFYDNPPVPRQASETAIALDKAIEAKDVTTLRQLSFPSGEGEVAMTASGIPVPAVASWHLARLTKEEMDIRAACQMLLSTAPSILSTAMLSELPGGTGEKGNPSFWLAIWQQYEASREALRLASPAWRPERKDPEELVIVSIETSKMIASLATLSSPRNGVSTVNFVRPLVAFVSPREPSHGRVLLEYELRAALETLGKKLRSLLPEWAAINVIAHGVSLGKPDVQVLSTGEARGFQIQVGSLNPDLILLDHRRLVWWATALIGVSGITALMGLVFLHRTLHRERRLNDMKSQFVSSVSHELRAPIGSVRLMADALASGKVTGPPAAEFHRLIASEGSRLSALIENVLDFARIEQGRKRYTLAETDLAALIQDAVLLMTPQAGARKQSIRLELESLPADPKLDAPALQQALINLLDNALKFSPPQSEIIVSLKPHPSEQAFILTITDPGSGIPASEHSRIFERFYRLGNELQRETTGTGIGLAIVKHIVEGHRGRIEVESPLSGNAGTRMMLTLPMNPGPPSE